MITKKDVKEIIRSAFEPVVKDIASIKSDVSSLKTDVFSLKTDVSTLKTDVSTLKNDVSTVKLEITKLRKAEETASKYFDTVTTGHASRIKTIERHLGFPTPLN